MEILTNIEKKGKNKHQGYEYMSIEDVVKAFRPAFVEAGIAFSCDCEQWHVVDKLIIFDFKMKFINVDSPDDIESVKSSAIIAMINDTAPGKAAAYAVKNALTKNFLIPAGKGEDVEHFDTGRAAPTPAPAPRRVPIQTKTAAVIPQNDNKEAEKVIDDLYECESLNELKGVWRGLGENIPQGVWDKALPVYKKLQRSLK